MNVEESNKMISEFFMGKTLCEACGRYDPKTGVTLRGEYSSGGEEVCMECADDKGVLDVLGSELKANGRLYPVMVLPYSHWEYLMPVVVKIQELGYPYLISDCTCTFYEVWQEKMASHQHGETTRDAIYKAVVEFIEWYNENKVMTPSEKEKLISEMKSICGKCSHIEFKDTVNRFWCKKHDIVVTGVILNCNDYEYRRRK